MRATLARPDGTEAPAVAPRRRPRRTVAGVEATASPRPGRCNAPAAVGVARSTGASAGDVCDLHSNCAVHYDLYLFDHEGTSGMIAAWRAATILALRQASRDVEPCHISCRPSGRARRRPQRKENCGLRAAHTRCFLPRRWHSQDVRSDPASSARVLRPQRRTRARKTLRG